MEALEDMLPLVRFSAMDHVFLQKTVRPSGLVSDTELLNATMYRLDEKEATAGGGSSSPPSRNAAAAAASDAVPAFPGSAESPPTSASASASASGTLMIQQF